MSQIRFYAYLFYIGQMRRTINDAMNKGYKITYQEQGNFLYSVFTIKGKTKDVKALYNHLKSQA